MSRKKQKPEAAAKNLRCAIYTRKSTEEGLEQEFNSLDAQREAGEAYVKSQQHEGWVCLPTAYDDGGFTGANMERPALHRLLADIEAGKVDVVVVYKVDRLSRSLLDFARIMEVFERRNVSFVSVTQAFNTASSMGRLVLNVLLSFAQFEREMISERTRDKIAAARRKGKWSGGMPILGYTVMDTKLVVDEAEAQRVREIFDLYRGGQTLLSVVNELNARGWRTKTWTTRKGTTRGGHPFNKSLLHQLLRNVAYIGKIRYKDEIHVGEHQPIVDVKVFEEVQTLLRRNGKSGGAAVRNKYNAILHGVIRCASCNCGMSNTYTQKRGRHYRYYVCNHAQKTGWASCPSPSIPAGEIERFVVEQIRSIGCDPAVLRETLDQVRRKRMDHVDSLTSERAVARSQLRELESRLRKLTAEANHDASLFHEVEESLRAAEQQVSQLDSELAKLEAGQLDENEIKLALAQFEEVWNQLAPREQARVIELLIERVAYDAKAESISITFRPTGIKALADELASRKEVTA